MIKSLSYAYIAVHVYQGQSCPACWWQVTIALRFYMYVYEYLCNARSDATVQKNSVGLKLGLRNWDWNVFHLSIALIFKGWNSKHMSSFTTSSYTVWNKHDKSITKDKEPLD
jgi:hypothetical protein